jgi:soluble lytic murein transglycosylase-like protein
MTKRIFISAVVFGVAALSAQAAERITLRNGFEMRCDHHAQVADKVRLYTGTDDQSFIEFPADNVMGVDQVPDPPPPPPEIAEVPAPPVKPAFDAKLSQEDLHELLTKAGNDHNVDVDLLASLVHAESGGNARAVSRTGAKGLMQLMPKTASSLGVDDSFRPDQNVRGGTTYLDSLLTYYHDNLALALAAYNAGPAAVDKYHGIPPYAETRVYVARVIHEFNRRVRAREAQARQALAAATPPTVVHGTR